MPYHEDKIASTIEDAVKQLRASKKNGNNLETAKSIIAFWSESNSLSFSMLLYMDMIGAQLKESPKRYSLFDWSFSKYRDLSGIALFELKSQEGANFWDVYDFNNLTPMAYLITNPFFPEDEISLKSAINEMYCKFLKGIDADPLA